MQRPSLVTRRPVVAARVGTLVRQLRSVPAAAAGDDVPWGGGWGQRYDFNHPPTPLYNTAKQKLLEGSKVFSFQMNKFDVDFYLEARKHYDFCFFEMQHSTMTYKDIETMIKEGSKTGEAGAIPFVRMHSPATEHVFQQCSDIGALGFIVPTVDTVEQAQEAAKWARFPPVARRSTGLGQAPQVWRRESRGTYNDTFNDNVVLVVMLETPEAIANAHAIASVPGVDVVITGNYECVRVAILSWFSAELANSIATSFVQPASLQRDQGGRPALQSDAGNCVRGR
jgi:2-keto-3-deoxy-L-rhamnonate aldolase RhmA